MTVRVAWDNWSGQYKVQHPRTTQSVENSHVRQQEEEQEQLL